MFNKINSLLTNSQSCLVDGYFIKKEMWVAFLEKLNVLNAEELALKIEKIKQERSIQ